MAGGLDSGSIATIIHHVGIARQSRKGGPAVSESAQEQLESWIDRYSPGVASVARHAIAWLRSRFPGAFVLVYDNYNALVVGFCSTERASDAVFSVALYPKWVNLFFLRGAEIDDPAGLLQGAGKQVRSIRLTATDILHHPDVISLVDRAAAHFGLGDAQGHSSELIIKAVSEKKRARQPRAAKPSGLRNP